jgi:hypothetical protein
MYAAKPTRFNMKRSTYRNVLALPLHFFIATVMLPSPLQAASLAYYGFEFDLRQDGQHAAIISYEYFDGPRVLKSRFPDSYTNADGLGVEDFTALMPRGTKLHVKWRDTSTREVFEDTVMLDKKLPKDMSNKIISLMIRGRQLQVFLTSTNMPHVPGTPVIGPSLYRSHVTVQIYPS